LYVSFAAIELQSHKYSHPYIMKYLQCIATVFALLLLPVLNSRAQTTNYPAAAYTATNDGAGGSTNALAVAYDASGNMYVAGSFTGEMNADATGATSTYKLVSNGNIDMFVAKYSATGSLIWAFNVGGTNGDVIRSIAVDASGYIYVAGTITGSTSTNIDADPSSNTNNITGATSSSSVDVFVAKYDGNTTPSNSSFYKWAFTTGGTGTDLPYKIVADGSGNIYVAGAIVGTTAIDVDPSSNSNTLTGAGGNDMFIAKYDGTLTPSSTSFYKWAFRVGGTGSDLALNLALDASGYLYVSGAISGTTSTIIDANPTSNTNNVTGATTTNNADIFIAKYDATKTLTDTSFYKWAFTLGGVGSDQATSIKVDASGNVYVGGFITGTTSTNIDMDPSSNTNTISGATTTNSQDMFVAKYDGTLTPSSTSFYKWGFVMGQTGTDQVQGMDVDTSGMVYVSGEAILTSSTGFDANPTSNTDSVFGSTTTNSQDMFLAKYDGTKTLSDTSFYQWAFVMGAAGTDALTGLAVSSSKIYTVGNVGNTTSGASFDADPSSNTNTVTGNSSSTVAGVMIYDNTVPPSSTSFYKSAFSLGYATSTSNTAKVAVMDASGNTYVTGTFAGVIVLGSGSNTVTLTSNNGSQDGYVAKYNAAGSILWAFSLGGTGTELLRALTIDNSGNIYVGGLFTGTTTTSFDADPSSNTNNVTGATTSSSSDIFVAKYDGTLTPASTSFYKWAFVVGGTGADQVNDLAVDGSGNVYVGGQVTGTTSTTFDADPSSNTNNVSGAGSSSSADLFVAKYDGTLTPSSASFYKWAFVIGVSSGGSTDVVNSIAVDGSGMVYVGGTYICATGFSMDADPSSNTNTVGPFSSSGTNEMFIGKYDGTLTPSNTSFYQWAFGMGNSGTDIVNKLLLDGSGNLYVGGNITGSTSTTIDADPSTNTNNVTGATSSNTTDMFIAKYDATVAPSSTSFYKWAFVVGGSAGADQVNSMTLDGSENLYIASTITGTTSTTIDADPSSNTHNVTGATSTSSVDIFVAKYNDTLTPSDTAFYKWAFTVGGTSSDQSNSIFYGDGRIALVGAYTGAISLQPGSSTTTNTSAQNGLIQSMFLANYQDAISWNGATSTDWNTGSNWVGGNVPTSTDNALIPSTGVTNEPNVGANSSINALTISSGRTLTISSGKTLSVAGSLVNNATVSGSGTLSLNGTSAQGINGTGTISNMELNNSSGATIASGTTSISSNYKPTSGILTTNGNLTLLSASGSTATIGQGSSSGGYISGNVTVQQYIPGGHRAMRFFAHPFSSAISLDQLEDNIDITGTGGASNGFTTTIKNSPSSFWYDQSVGDGATATTDIGWTAFTSTNGAGSNAWNVDEGIRALVRGSKGQTGSLTGGTYTPNAVTIDMNGPVNQGTHTVNMTKGSNTPFVFIGNPYPCQIDLNLATLGSGVNGSFYVWNPSTGTYGAYETNPWSSSYILPANAGFFVSLSSNASITFHESDKSSAASSSSLFKTTGGLLQNRVMLKVLSNNDSLQWDRLLFYFDTKGKADSDWYDGIKMFNPDMSFYSFSADNKRMALDVRPMEDGKVIPLGIKYAPLKNYVIKAEELNLPPGATLKLHDKYTGTVQTLTAGAEYAFSVTSDTNTQGDKRFELNMIQLPTNIVAESSPLNLSISPNPANDIAILSFSATSVGVTTLQLVTMTGKEVLKMNLGNMQKGNITIPMQGIVPGMYVVKLRCGNTIESKKLIKN